MRRVAAFVAVILLAGCLHPSTPQITSAFTSSSPSDCGQPLCLADPTSSDARYVRQASGLRQITNDKDSVGWLTLSGGLLGISVAQVTPTPRDRHDVYAYSLRTSDLFSVAAHPTDNEYLPTADGDWLVYNLSNGTFGGGVLWNRATQSAHRIENGMGGHSKIQGFDYPWVAFSQGSSLNQTDNGYWAYNLEDHRKVFLYKPLPRNQLPDKSYETIVGVEVFNGTAMYVLSRATPENQPSKQYNMTVYTVNLESGKRHEYHHPTIGAYRFSYGGRYVAIESGLEAWVLDSSTGEFLKYSMPGEECGFPSTNGAWAVYGCARKGQGQHSLAILIVDLSSRQRAFLSGGGLQFEKGVTDGESIVVKALPSAPDVFQNFSSQLYWAPISELRLQMA